MTRRWQPNVPAVTSEQFDDEVVLVNFDTGKYHSIKGTGVAVWQCLASKPTVDALVRHVEEAFETGGAKLAEQVERFLTELQREGLIVEAPPDAPAAPLPAPAPGRPPFEPPEFSTFSDMQELLWLDPIHEVDEAGWPIARTDDGR